MRAAFDELRNLGRRLRDTFGRPHTPTGEASVNVSSRRNIVRAVNVGAKGESTSVTSHQQTRTVQGTKRTQSSRTKKSSQRRRRR